MWDVCRRTASTSSSAIDLSLEMVHSEPPSSLKLTLRQASVWCLQRPAFVRSEAASRIATGRARWREGELSSARVACREQGKGGRL
eukprot:SAG11_NODE_1207_length_5524_cov_2.959447_2_plen_86_part_00